MKFSAIALVAAAVAGVSAHYDNVTYVTEVVTALTTYCPAPTEVVHGGKTYTITKATTLTITDCPCTVTKPVYTSKVVECNTCGHNYTKPVPTKATSTTKGTVPTAAAGKLAALSGAGLAGVVGLAAFVL